MEVRYIGDPNDGFAGPAEIEQFGYSFVKGEYVEVPDDSPFAAKFKGNQTFEVKGSDRPKASIDEEAELASVQEALDAKGVKYHRNAKLPALRKLLADQHDNDVDGPELPPVPDQ